MAYSVDWIAKIVSVPTSDLTLVSGTHYQLQMSAFLIEIRRLESAFNEGLWAPQILDHTNPKLDFAGSDYAGFDEMINGYTLQVTGAATRVDLLGSNNNVVDVLIATGVSLVPSNSAGLQLVTVETGVSGLTAQESTWLSSVPQIETDVGTIQTDIGTLQTSVSNIEGDIGLLQTDVASNTSVLVLLQKYVENKKEVIKETGQWYLYIYDTDDSTPILKKLLQDKDQAAITDLLPGVIAIEGRTSV